jgi:hypothetical protein
MIRRITGPRNIIIGLELEGAGTREEEMTSNHATKIAQNTKEMTIVNRCGSRDKLTQNMDRIRYIRASDSKIDKAPNKMMIACRIREGITIRSTKLDIERHRSLNNALITKSSTSKKILDILFLGDIKTIRSGENLNPKKVAKRTNDVYTRFCSCRQCWASKCRGL